MARSCGEGRHKPIGAATTVMVGSARKICDTRARKAKNEICHIFPEIAFDFLKSNGETSGMRGVFLLKTPNSLLRSANAVRLGGPTNALCGLKRSCKVRTP